MAATYRTKQDETLDWICWQYYVKEVTLSAAALAADSKLLNNMQFMDMGFLLNAQSDDNIRGAVEQVLQVNPGLASYPLNLPAGLEIQLPDLPDNLVVSDTLNIWS